MRRLAVSLAFLSLAGCLTTPPTPPAAPAADGRVHVVQRGDTLYNIAFRYGVDHRDLARWNGLNNPDLIYVGQRVRLSPPGGATGARSSAASSGQASPTNASRNTPAARPAPLPDPPSSPSPAWQWPADGRVVSAFGSQSGGISSGIAISGQAGQPVHAAAPGRVVYAGTGLIGYGQLVIIMHNDTYLSAYGYNERLLVSQGQGVERGQAIAEMGTGPGREPRLHFEIRRNGVPVDPLPYLQTRR